MRQFTPEERNAIVMAYQQFRGTDICYKKVVASFTNKFPDSMVPKQQKVLKMWKKQQTFFTVHNINSASSPGDTHSGRKRTARSEENIAAVKAAIDGDNDKAAEDPTINTCRKNMLGLNPSTWCWIEHKDLQYYSYKLEVSEGLLPQNYQRRIRFAQYFINVSRSKKKNVSYSDKATFSLDGEINTQNIHRYAPRKQYGEKMWVVSPLSSGTPRPSTPARSWCFLASTLQGILLVSSCLKTKP